jgi:hypothetical protein
MVTLMYTNSLKSVQYFNGQFERASRYALHLGQECNRICSLRTQGMRQTRHCLHKVTAMTSNGPLLNVSLSSAWFALDTAAVGIRMFRACFQLQGRLPLVCKLSSLFSGYCK